MLFSLFLSSTYSVELHLSFRSIKANPVKAGGAKPRVYRPRGGQDCRAAENEPPLAVRKRPGRRFFILSSFAGCSHGLTIMELFLVYRHIRPAIHWKSLARDIHLLLSTDHLSSQGFSKEIKKQQSGCSKQPDCCLTIPHRAGGDNTGVGTFFIPCGWGKSLPGWGLYWHPGGWLFWPHGRIKFSLIEPIVFGGRSTCRPQPYARPGCPSGAVRLSPDSGCR